MPVPLPWPLVSQIFTTPHVSSSRLMYAQLPNLLIYSFASR